MLSLPLDSTDRPRLPAVPDDAVVAAPAAAGDALQVLDDPQA